MRVLIALQTSLVVLLVMTTAWWRLAPSDPVLSVALSLSQAVAAGGLLLALLMALRCIRRRSVADGLAPAGANIAVLLASLVAHHGFWQVLGAVAAST
jgi:hypothetical protein